MSRFEAVRTFIQQHLTPPRVFLSLALTLGLGVLFANPPFQAADEYEHFFRAFQLSQGQIIGQKQGNTAGGELSAAVNGVASPGEVAFHPENKVNAAYFANKLHPGWMDWDKAPRMFIAFPHTVFYSPLTYLPQTVGIVLGKLLHVGPLGLMYLARLGGFFASVTFGYFALLCLPVYRQSVLLLLVMPTTLYLMGSVAPDGVLITGSALLISLLLRADSCAAHHLGWKEKLIILFLAALLPMSKFVYLPISVLAPLFLFRRLRPGWNRNGFLLAWTLSCLLPTWLWGRVILSIYVPGRADILIDPFAQLHYISAHPAEFITLVVQSIAHQASDYCRSMIGLLGWNDTFLPKWFYHIFAVGFLGCLLLESKPGAYPGWPARLILIGSALSVIFLTHFALYVHWNSPGSHGLIEGISGRYFLPAILLLIPALPPLQWVKGPDTAARTLSSLMAALSAIVCLTTVVMRYYIA